MVLIRLVHVWSYSHPGRGPCRRETKRWQKRVWRLPSLCSCPFVLYIISLCLITIPFFYTCCSAVRRDRSDPDSIGPRVFTGPLCLSFERRLNAPFGIYHPIPCSTYVLICWYHSIINARSCRTSVRECTRRSTAIRLSCIVFTIIITSKQNIVSLIWWSTHPHELVLI